MASSRRSQAASAARLSVDLGLLTLVCFASSVSAQTLDITTTTPRLVEIDIEVSPDPVTTGADVGAVFGSSVGLTELQGVWTSDGTIGTITTLNASYETWLLAACAALDPTCTLTAVDPPGNYGNPEIVIDVASGHADWEVTGTHDNLSGGTLTLFQDFHSDGGPFGPFSYPGTVGGYEEDSAVPGIQLFCTDQFDLFSGAGTGPCGVASDGGTQVFGRPSALIPGAAYDNVNGLLHMPGVTIVLPGTVIYNLAGDMKVNDLPEPAGGMALAVGVGFLGALQRRRRRRLR